MTERQANPSGRRKMNCGELIREVTPDGRLRTEKHLEDAKFADLAQDAGSV